MHLNRPDPSGEIPIFTVNIPTQIPLPVQFLKLTIGHSIYSLITTVFVPDTQPFHHLLLNIEPAVRRTLFMGSSYRTWVNLSMIPCKYLVWLWRLLKQDRQYLHLNQQIFSDNITRLSSGSQKQYFVLHE